MNTLAILGAGGHGRVVADVAEASGQWQNIVFFDDCWPDRTHNGPWQIVGDIASLENRAPEFGGVIVAIGGNRIRLKYSQTLDAAGAHLATIIHPRATLSRHATIGQGSVICAGAVINIGASVGRACIINTGATIDHDCTLADGVHISPGANLAGSVTVGLCSWIGTSVGIRQEVVVGSNVIVGVGAVVVNNLLNGITVVGNPAKTLNRTF